MSLKEVVSQRVLAGILGSLYKEGEWKVLVLDKLSTRIISSCCKMHDVVSKGITLVECLEKSRQPLPKLEAIYIMVPSEQGVQYLMDDFKERPLYKAAHIFFLEKCSTSLFSKLGASKASKRIATLKEANMAFLPYESRVFTLDYPEAFQDFYAVGSVGKGQMVERIAEQLATVCAMLGEYPAVRYRSDVNHIADIAGKVQDKLDAFKADKRELGSGPDKGKSQLIILDRGFDVVSPLLHELTYQAMVYDLLSVKNDVYTYQADTGDGGDQKRREVILDENDELWLQYRHQHIAEVKTVVAKNFEEFGQKKKLKHQGDADMSVKDLARYIKKVPQYQKELRGYALHIGMLETCLRKFRTGIKDLCKVEQNLALGEDAQGEPIVDPMKDVMQCIFTTKEREKSSIKTSDKLRLLMLFILFKGGVSKDDFAKLVQHFDIPLGERKVLLNLMHLGQTVLTDEKVKAPKKLRPKDRREEERYEVSRWVPLLRDLAEYAATDSLDDGYCPWLRSKPRATSSITSASSGVSPAAGGASGASVRQRWNWVPPKQGEGSGAGKATPGVGAVKKASGPTIIIFVVGGMTYSEMRSVYEASDVTSNHVLIGSTSIMTSNEFLHQLKDLRPLVSI